MPYFLIFMLYLWFGQLQLTLITISIGWFYKLALLDFELTF